MNRARFQVLAIIAFVLKEYCSTVWHNKQIEETGKIMMHNSFKVSVSLGWRNQKVPCHFFFFCVFVLRALGDFPAT